MTNFDKTHAFHLTARRAERALEAIKKLDPKREVRKPRLNKKGK